MYALVARTKAKPGLACAAGSWGRLRYMYALLTPFTLNRKTEILEAKLVGPKRLRIVERKY